MLSTFTRWILSNGLPLWCSEYTNHCLSKEWQSLARFPWPGLTALCWVIKFMTVPGLLKWFSFLGISQHASYCDLLLQRYIHSPTWGKFVTNDFCWGGWPVQWTKEAIGADVIEMATKKTKTLRLLTLILGTGIFAVADSNFVVPTKPRR